MTKKLTPEQGAILSAYTGILCGGFREFHEYAEKLMGRPLWIHELSQESIQAEIRELAKTDFLEMLATVKETR